MTTVTKYNLCKGASTLCTIGTPIITMCCCSDFFISQPDTAISATGVFAILLSLLFAKDKLAENFKMPSAFIVSIVTLILILMIESIIVPIKYVCIATMCTTGIDEITFKRMYKNIDCKLSNKNVNKFAGFITTSSNNLED